MQLAVTAWDLSNTDALKSIPDQAVIAEDMGFSGFWLPENHFTGTASLASPLLLLAAAAAKTKTIRLGTTSYLLPIRNPVEAAEDVATLDCISNGRLILGARPRHCEAQQPSLHTPRRVSACQMVLAMIMMSSVSEQRLM